MQKVAVIGVEEGVGREVLNLLAENEVKVKDVVALEPRSALGNMISYGEDDELDVLSLDGFDFSKVKLAVFATSAEVAKKYIPHALKAGVKVVDASGASSEGGAPMIVCGINEDKLQEGQNLVSVPSSEVSQMLLPLQAVKDYKIKRIVVSTYSATSVYGRPAMDELFNQTRKIFMNDTLADDQNVFHKQIAFNVIPHIGEFIGEETSGEWSFNTETKQVLGGDVKVHANCAIIPAFIGSAQYVNVECDEDVDVADVREKMKKIKGVVVFDKQVDGGYVTLHDVQGENDIYVSRLRQDVSVENGFSFWCVADSQRAAGAKNIINVLHLLAKQN